MKFDDTLVNHSNFGDCKACHTLFGVFSDIIRNHSVCGEILGTLENSALIIVVGGASEKSSSIVLLTWKFLRCQSLTRLAKVTSLGNDTTQP